MKDEPTRICQECKHYKWRRGWLWNIHQCKVGYIDLVTGDPGFAECEPQRESPVCGPEGKLWEPTNRSEGESCYVNDAPPE